MTLEFTKRAVSDLREISAQSRRLFGDRIAAALEERFRHVFSQISSAPESAPRVEQRPHIRVVPLVRYPFKIFYTILNDM